MSEQRQKILAMLAEGKITAEEAERLLDALASSGPSKPEASECCADSGKLKRLCIHVEPKGPRGHKEVNVRVPLLLVKAGAKLGSLMPKKSHGKVSSALKDHGIDLDLGKLNSGDIDVILQHLAAESIDVEDENERVRIYCE